MKNLIGAVLCGGKSTRMGTDKGLIPQNEENWASAAVNKMRFLDIPIILSINDSQKEKYGQIFSNLHLVTDHDIHAHGSLQGLLSIHLEYPENDILLIACDMLNIDAKTLGHLIEIYHTEPEFDFYAYHHEQALGPVYQASHRNGYVGYCGLIDYDATKRWARMESKTPYPVDYQRGLLTNLLRKYKDAYGMALEVKVIPPIENSDPEVVYFETKW